MLTVTEAHSARVDELLQELAEYRKLGILNAQQEQSLLTMQRTRWKYERELVQAAAANNP